MSDNDTNIVNNDYTMPVVSSQRKVEHAHRPL